MTPRHMQLLRNTCPFQFFLRLDGRVDVAVKLGFGFDEECSPYNCENGLARLFMRDRIRGV